ncbi:hypothetical protein NQ315_012581 [Exocentrus adspersus]|uniref:Uncharacterized protein n=1 Tax=Exocentrus adspersus TaxID=1586481 RepID=A0AAV8V4P8_9CUCU|nr:hypothetical protein NQ315_012581 [Exocentrus adspersus]
MKCILVMYSAVMKCPKSAQAPMRRYRQRRLRPNQLRRLRQKLRYTLGIARRKSQLLTSHYTEQTCLQPDQEPTPNQQGSKSKV